MLGNWFSVVALCSWPIVAGILYKVAPVSLATIWTILAAFLLLPAQVAIKFQMIPALDKTSIPNLCALIGCVLLAQRQNRLRSRSWLAGFCMFIYVMGPVLTSVLNNDTVVIGDRVLPGVGSYDGISAGLSQLIAIFPFFIGRRLLRSSADIEAILGALVLAGLFYSIPTLFEIRMSPQLSTWIYGYFPSSFATEMRYGGYRPVVFLNNGLVLAFFLMTSFLASIAMWRAKVKLQRLPPPSIPAYLAMVLILCKSAGSLAYGVSGGLLVALVSPRVMTKIAVVLVSIGLLYPVLRLANVFPTQMLVDSAGLVDENRAGSLKFRFDQEDRLLAHATQRFLLGWGRYGRGRVYDQDTGSDESITDGLWIITLSTFGFVGFLAQFGLLALPVFRAASCIKFLNPKKDGVFLATLSIIVALSVVEQLPNASIGPLSWLLAGALLGRSEFLQSAASKTRRRRLVVQAGETSTPGYT